MKEIEKMAINAFYFLFFTFFGNLYSQNQEYFQNSRINFSYEKNNSGQSGMVTFNTKWNLNDAKNFYMLPYAFYKGIENIDMKKDIKFKYYGYKISPFKIVDISYKNKKHIGESASKTGENAISEGSEGSETVKSGKKKRLINLSALYEDIEENIDNFIIDNSFKPLSKEWASVSREGKKEFMRDFSSLGIFDASILSPVGKKAEELSNKKSESK